MDDVCIKLICWYWFMVQVGWPLHRAVARVSPLLWSSLAGFGFLFVLPQLCYCAFVSKEIYRTFQHAIPKAKTIEARKVKSSTTGSPRSPSAGPAGEGSAGEGSASAGSATSPVLSSCNPNPNSNPNFHVKSPNLSGSAGVGATGVAATSKSI